ncbi:hypothetical protein ACG33_10115 [Steroidobacter denitrificans]|uniref:Glycosyltransferase subfamily 4-like N-terminal domain-containing protein n=1 Tax=Steroidobacter denitrificans TaxID=465721 RepID=A0A127FCW8_STEDE|nr:glycosyltransferase [Steroidobacter denitrificans]AMN47445.1 hypothetical protein ACG33_10115 [Steroidobacter denitrificans]
MDVYDPALPRRRIVLLTAAATWSGVEVHTLGLARALRKHGHDVVIVELGRDIYSASSGPESSKIVRVDIGNEPINALSSSSFLTWVKLFRRIDCDIAISIKGTFKFGSLSMEAAALWCFKKFMVIEHMQAPLGKRTHTRYLGGLIPSVGLWWYRGRLAGYLRSIAPQKIICVSHAAALTLREDYRYPPAKLVTAHNGVDTDVFLPDAAARTRSRQKWNIPDDAFVFGSVGRLSPMKNHVQLVRAFHRLCTDGIPRDLRLVIVGEGPERDSIEMMIRSLRLEDKVTLGGFSASPEAIVPAFDVFCLSSLPGESLPLSLLEAMSCRIPAIASTVGGIPEVLSNESLGWLIPPGDDNALLNAMRKAAIHPPVLLEQMGTNARQEVQNRFRASEKWAELVEIICR